MEYFPLDLQHCVFTFESWSYGFEEIDYFAGQDGLSLKYYEEHPEWELLQTGQIKEEPWCLKDANPFIKERKGQTT